MTVFDGRSILRAPPGQRRQSLRSLHADLQLVTETLAIELACPGLREPDWSQAQWAIAPAVAAIHGVSALLGRRLSWRGPDEWMEFLRDQELQTAQRFFRMQQLLQRLNCAAQDAKVCLVPLKGAALYADGVYAAGERPMADIDLLVSPQQARRATELIERLGFEERVRNARHIVFESTRKVTPARLGEHSDNDLKIELHCAVREPLPLRAVDVSEQIFPRRLQPGMNAYPSRGALLCHLLLHAAGSVCYRGLRLLQLEDIARLTASMRSEHWNAWRQQMGKPLWWSFPPLCLTARYYGGIPHSVLEEIAEQCHWWLRHSSRRCTLGTVSCSHLWVRAFPGIGWASTPGELLRYMLSRMLPDSSTRAQRRRLVALQPQVSGGSWGRLSQTQRVMRWLAAPQPRHETLEPVRAALNRAHQHRLQTSGETASMRLYRPVKKRAS